MHPYTKLRPNRLSEQWIHSVEHVTPFGWLIKRLLAQREMTQRELAKRAGVGPSYLSAVLKGVKNNVSKSLMERISTALHLDEEEKEELLQAQDLSRNTYEIKDMPPWKWALVSNFYTVLPNLTQDVAGIVNAALALANEKQRLNDPGRKNQENKM
ncbi:helix-turn-helix domain-containing protein [Undibacterium sp. TC4M20W]|uniref:helix-turn-helix domain-containing protein n=1 Tax=Undibacterium sp. TC4M20W TaxID=3413052 RepID=UPI003BF25A22